MRFCRGFAGGFRFAPFKGQNIPNVHIRRHDAQAQKAAFIVAVAIEHAHPDHFVALHHHIRRRGGIVWLREIDPFEWRTLFKATCDDFQHIFAVPFESHLLAVWRIFQFKQRVLADEIFFFPANIEAIAQLKRVDVIVRDLFRHKATTNRTSRLIAVSAQPITVFLHHTITSVNSWQRRWNPARFQCVGRIGTAAHLHEINANVARDIGVDLVQVGSRAYSTNTLESGWIPSPLPGIYTGDGMMQEYRDWLGADSYEAAGSIGGSFVSKEISDYYVNPFELGYGFYIGWKKENFIGKDALLKLKDAPNRQKVTFEWNREDVLKVIASGLEQGTPFKWIDFPQPNYASSSADMVMQGDKMVGMSMFNGYSYNERCFLSLGVVAADVNIGDVLTLKWGEPEPTGKTSTEPHQQTEIRVRVSATPYAKDARENYADSWRTKAD